MLNITLVGGGNSTHVLAALAAEAGHNVSILTRRVGDWASDRVITMQNSDPGWLGGTPKVVGTVVTISSDTEALISGADVIVLAGLPCSPVPPHARADLPAYQAVGRHARFAVCVRRLLLAGEGGDGPGARQLRHHLRLSVYPLDVRARVLRHGGTLTLTLTS